MVPSESAAPGGENPILLEIYRMATATEWEPRGHADWFAGPVVPAVAAAGAPLDAVRLPRVCRSWRAAVRG